MIYEKMSERMRAVRLYDEDAVNLNTELSVYAEELERLHTELESALRERFITTAVDEGLSTYESLFGPVRSGESAASRREKLLLRLSLGEADFTPAGIRRSLDSLGIRYELSEYPSLYRLNINVTSDHSYKEKVFIRREVADMIPAHLNYQLTFNTLTWQQLDQMDCSFAENDSANLTWAQIDARTT